MTAILLALTGSTIASVGMVLQKKGIPWIGSNKKDKQDKRKHFWIWLTGIFLAYIVAAVPNSIAAQTLPPHIITSMAGWDIVLIVFLSGLILKEQVFKTDYLYSMVIVGMTLFIAFRSEPVSYFTINLPVMIILFLVPGLVLLPLLFKTVDDKVKSVLLSIFAGSMSGVAIVYFNMLMRDLFTWGFDKIPLDVLLLYAFSAVLGAIGEQASYSIGEMTIVASIRLSFFIVYPIFGSMLLFSSKADILQFIAVFIIILACYVMFKKRGRQAHKKS